MTLNPAFPQAESETPLCKVVIATILVMTKWEFESKN